jgi:hypothetical protein
MVGTAYTGKVTGFHGSSDRAKPSRSSCLSPGWLDPVLEAVPAPAASVLVVTGIWLVMITFSFQNARGGGPSGTYHPRTERSARAGRTFSHRKLKFGCVGRYRIIAPSCSFNSSYYAQLYCARQTPNASTITPTLRYPTPENRQVQSLCLALWISQAARPSLPVSAAAMVSCQRMGSLRAGAFKGRGT